MTASLWLIVKTSKLVDFDHICQFSHCFCGGKIGRNTVLPDEEAIRFLCDRHYGVGADCAVYIARSNNADYAMHIYNPDGFEAEMCGNAPLYYHSSCSEQGYLV